MAFTTLPAAGAKLRAATLSALVTEVRPVAVRKASSQIISNSTTLTNDNELFVSVEASLTYGFEIVVIYEAGTTADYKFALTFPTGSAVSWGNHMESTALGYLPIAYSSYTSGTAVAAGGASIGSPLPTVINGVIVVGGSAGTFRYQWAQNVATVENTATLAGSTFVLRRLS